MKFIGSTAIDSTTTTVVIAIAITIPTTADIGAGFAGDDVHSVPEATLCSLRVSSISEQLRNHTTTRQALLLSSSLSPSPSSNVFENTANLLRAKLLRWCRTRKQPRGSSSIYVDRTRRIPEKEFSSRSVTVTTVTVTVTL